MTRTTYFRKIRARYFAGRSYQLGTEYKLQIRFIFGRSTLPNDYEFYYLLVIGHICIEQVGLGKFKLKSGKFDDDYRETI